MKRMPQFTLPSLILVSVFFGLACGRVESHAQGSLGSPAGLGGESAAAAPDVTIMGVTEQFYPAAAWGQPEQGDEDEEINENDTTPVLDLDYAWNGRSDDAYQWTHYTADAIEQYGQDLLEAVPRDYARFCPNYKNLDREGRKAFYVQLISGIASEESSFKPSQPYKEKFKNSKNQRVISRGLLQLSLESVQLYDCDIQEDLELNDPQKNLTCGVRILNQWIANDNVIAGGRKKAWRGGARYWSVLRREKDLKFIRHDTQTLSVCAIPPKPLKKPKQKTN